MSVVFLRSPKAHSLVAVLLIAALVVYFGVLKTELFHSLSYHGDFFLQVQVARGIFEGRPLFFDNMYAPHSYIHNYFVLILLGPLVYYTGAYGLIIAHCAFLLAAAVKTFRVLRGFGYLPTFSLLTVVAILLGPISFWILDDPVYGWHTELLFLPLGFLFFLSLSQPGWPKFLWGLLIVLNREDGAVLACSLHLLHVFIENGKDKSLLSGWKRYGLIAFGWFAIFALGIGALYLFADPAISRQTKAKDLLFEALTDPTLRQTLLLMLEGTIYLLLPIVPMYFCGLRWKNLWISLLALLPTLMIATIASSTYLSKSDSTLYHGTSWPPRFAMLWCVVACGCIASLLKKDVLSSTQEHWSVRRLFVACLLLSVFGQAWALSHVRHYQTLEAIAGGSNDPNGLAILKIRPKERRLLSCLSEKLPLHITVAHTGPLSTYFHRHDFVHGNKAHDAWKYPEVFVCDMADRLRAENGCRSALAHERNALYIKGRYKGFRFAYDPKISELPKVFEECVPKKKRLAA